MGRYLYDNQKKHYTFDFSKKRVTENGKVMEKFSIGYAVLRNGDFCNGEFYRGFLIEQDAYNYEDSKQILLSLLEQKQFSNVTIIK